MPVRKSATFCSTFVLSGGPSVRTSPLSKVSNHHRQDARNLVQIATRNSILRLVPKKRVTGFFDFF